MNYYSTIVNYTIGGESAPVVETESLNNSIFAAEYHKASKVLEAYLSHPRKNSPQILAFCGDRGDGKTSCMLSFMNIINADKDDNSEASKFLKEYQFPNILDTKFESLGLIDPSFFDSDRNLLELILGKLYAEMKSFAESNHYKLDRQTYNDVVATLSRIKSCLVAMHLTPSNTYSDLTDLDMLAGAVELQALMRKLIKGYLKLKGSHKLIIAIDDIDLCMGGAYKMCEQIRKYLCFEECILLLAVKHEQLETAVALGLSDEISISKSNLISSEECRIMAKKYLAKFLPTAIRIQLPKVLDLCDRSLRIHDGEGIKDYFNTVKNGVVNLIFRRTRYLFYNNKGGVSNIIPSNLRELMSLLGLLYQMNEIWNQDTQSDELLRNKEGFKDYFFFTWSKNLSDDHRNKVIEWVADTQEIKLNKSVICWLWKEISETLLRKYVIDDNSDENSSTPVSNLIENIINSENFSYNVSVGDVFFLLNLLELDRLEPEIERMIFFIKSYYSIRLYETYDISSESGEKIATQNIIEESSIYDVDKRFVGTSDLQRLLGGAYFTYLPGMLIRKDGSKGYPSYLDRKVIKGGDPLSELFSECKSIMSSYDEKYALYEEAKELFLIDDNNDMIKYKETELRGLERKFQLMEFFILTILRSVKYEEVDKFYNGADSYRLNSTPAAYNKFNINIGYYVFDVMAPFYNLANPRYCYDRFSTILPDIYEFALRHPFSLLYKMLAQVTPWKPEYADQEKEYNHALGRLLSDAVIRNGEVLSAMFENAKGARNKDKDSGGLSNIRNFYSNIAKSNMRTHAKMDMTDTKGYDIKFSFLNPLIEFFNENILNPTDDTVKNIFLNIFEGVETQRQNKSSESSSKKKSSRQTSAKSSVKSTQRRNDAQYMMLKKHLTEEVESLVGEGPWTAPELWDLLRNLDVGLDKLPDRDLKRYVPKRKGNAEYTFNDLVETILRDPDRQILWADLF